VDQHVEPPEVAQELPYRGSELVVSRQVSLEDFRGAAGATRDATQRLRAAADQTDGGAARCERFDYGGADVSAGAGDERGLTVERLLVARRRRGACCRTSR
jgi:hypothetical protein